MRADYVHPMTQPSIRKTMHVVFANTLFMVLGHQTRLTCLSFHQQQQYSNSNLHTLYYSYSTSFYKRAIRQPSNSFNQLTAISSSTTTNISTELTCSVAFLVDTLLPFLDCSSVKLKFTGSQLITMSSWLRLTLFIFSVKLPDTTKRSIRQQWRLIPSRRTGLAKKPTTCQTLLSSLVCDGLSSMIGTR